MPMETLSNEYTYSEFPRGEREDGEADEEGDEKAHARARRTQEEAREPLPPRQGKVPAPSSSALSPLETTAVEPTPLHVRVTHASSSLVRSPERTGM